jgi:hypothetical protein
MRTLQIFSNKADDLLLLNEMARRLNLKTELKLPETNPCIGRPMIEYEDTAEEVVEGIKRALLEVEESMADKRKLKTLEELLNENRDLII